MLTKKSLVASLLTTALVGLTAACSADASGDGAAADSEALANDSPEPGTPNCDPRNPACQCHTLESCNELEKICLQNGGKMACGDPQTCFCTFPARTQPTSPSRIVRATSGVLAP